MDRAKSMLCLWHKSQIHNRLKVQQFYYCLHPLPPFRNVNFRLVGLLHLSKLEIPYHSMFQMKIFTWHVELNLEHINRAVCLLIRRSLAESPNPLVWILMHFSGVNVRKCFGIYKSTV